MDGLPFGYTHRQKVGPGLLVPPPGGDNAQSSARAEGADKPHNSVHMHRCRRRRDLSRRRGPLTTSLIHASRPPSTLPAPCITTPTATHLPPNLRNSERRYIPPPILESSLHHSSRLRPTPRRRPIVWSNATRTSRKCQLQRQDDSQETAWISDGP